MLNPPVRLSGSDSVPPEYPGIGGSATINNANFVLLSSVYYVETLECAEQRCIARLPAKFFHYFSFQGFEAGLTVFYATPGRNKPLLACAGIEYRA